MDADKVVITIEIEGKSYKDYGNHKISHTDMLIVLDQVVGLIRAGNDDGYSSSSNVKYEYKVEEDPDEK